MVSDRRNGGMPRPSLRYHGPRVAGKRRTAFAGGAPRRVSCIAVCIMVCVAGGVSAQPFAPPIRIGVLADLSGIYKDIGGQGSIEAAKLAAEEFGGRIGARAIEIVSADAQNKPDIASAIATSWYDREGVSLIVDLPVSSLALTVQEIARTRGKISVVTGGATSDLTGKACSPTGFHWVWDTYAMSHGTGQAVVKAGGKTWYFITGDFVAAVVLEQQARDAIVASGGIVLGATKYPSPNFDFSSQLLQAQQSGAQVVGLSSAGQDVINAIKQAAEFGLTPRQQIVGLIIYITDVHALGLPAAAGMQFMSGFYWDNDDQTRAWSRMFSTRMGGSMPTMSQAGVYSAVRHYLQAVKESGTDDGPTVAAQMKATPVNDMFARNGILRADGLMVHDLQLVQVKSPSESKGPWDYFKTILEIPGGQAFIPLSQSGCPLVPQ